MGSVLRPAWLAGLEEWEDPATGDLHRLDGPAVTATSPSMQAWFAYGRRHRADGPALVAADYEQWWFEGRLHRVAGPAVEHGDGRREWRVRGSIVVVPGEPGSDEALAELSRLYDSGELERLELVLTTWRPGGPSVVELAAAVAVAVS